MSKKREDAEPHRFRVTVERERTIFEARTIVIHAYTSSSASKQSKSRLPHHGWQELQGRQGPNGRTNLLFSQVTEVEDLGKSAAAPDDPVALSEFLNAPKSIELLSSVDWIDLDAFLLPPPGRYFALRRTFADGEHRELLATLDVSGVWRSDSGEVVAISHFMHVPTAPL